MEVEFEHTKFVAHRYTCKHGNCRRVNDFADDFQVFVGDRSIILDQMLVELHVAERTVP